MLVNEVPQDLNRRPGSAWAKKSTRKLQNFVGPTQLLVFAFKGLDEFLHQLYARVPTHAGFGAQPILADTNLMAAHSEG